MDIAQDVYHYVKFNDYNVKYISTMHFNNSEFITLHSVGFRRLLRKYLIYYIQRLSTI